MKVVGLCGWSGSGKTTLLEQLIAKMRARGARVSVVKHAHHEFDIDHPGKDSWRHRKAGAYEVVIASRMRMAKLREFEAPAEPRLHELLAEVSEPPGRELWVFVEGFKRADLPKLEVWRAQTNKPVQYPHDPFIVAVATDSPNALPSPTALPLLDLNDAGAVLEFLIQTADRYEYRSEPAAAAESAPAHVEPGRRARHAVRVGQAAAARRR